MAYTLTHGDIILGSLIIVDGDFPWHYCEFTPTEHFDFVREEFEYFQKLHDQLIEKEDEELWAQFDRLCFELNKKYHILNATGEREQMAIGSYEDNSISIRPIDTEIFDREYEDLM